MADEAIRAIVVYLHSARFSVCALEEGAWEIRSGWHSPRCIVEGGSC